MRFLILGAGALGGYFGGMLAKGGADVTFLVRPRRAAQLAGRGLVVKTPAGEFAVPAETVQAGEVVAPYDVVLLACKAYDLDSAVEAIAPAVGDDTAILTVLNGIGHLDILAQRFGTDRLLGGVTFVRADLTEEGDVIQSATGLDETAFGELTGDPSARGDAINAVLAAAGVRSRVSDNIRGEMWAKFCAWAALAAVLTLTRGFTGEVAAAPAGMGFAAAAFDETARITAAEGYPPPSGVRDAALGLFSRPGLMLRLSMAADLEEGRRTEHEETIGDLVRRAERRAIEVPILRAALCNLQIADARRQRALAATI
jgi:2-dehydropantoate 2-reductase